MSFLQSGSQRSVWSKGVGEDVPRGGTGVEPRRAVRRHLPGEWGQWGPFHALGQVMDEPAGQQRLARHALLSWKLRRPLTGRDFFF